MNLIKINAKKFFVFCGNKLLSGVVFFSVRRFILNLTGEKKKKKSTIHRNILFYCFDGLHVGENSTINFGCIIDPRGELYIGDNVSVSHCVKIYTAGHNVKNHDAAFFKKSVTIKNNAWIFPNSTIMPGVKIGVGAVVYPGSVVVRDVDDFSIVAGNPAKPVGVRPRDISYTASFPVWFGI